jgi:hypothetical protein
MKPINWNIIGLLWVLLLITGFFALHGPAGSDAIAYQAFACTQDEAIKAQLTTNWFDYPCSNIDYLLTSLAFTILAVISLTFVINKYTQQDNKLFVLVLFGITPLFYSVFVGQPNQFMGFALACCGIALIELVKDFKKPDMFLLFGLVNILLSFFFWRASPILILAPLFFRYDKTKISHKIGALVLFLLLLALFWNDLTGTFNAIINQNVISAEQAPGLGIIFIIPFLLFWKKMPKNLQIISAIFIIIGLIHAKYMFLAVPWLTVGFLNWINENKKHFNLIVLGFLLINLVSVGFLVYSLFPTQDDVNLADTAISTAKDTNLYWSYDYKWLMYAKGIPFQYTDGPNFQDLNKPFYAIIRQDDNLNCPVIASAENQPLKYYLVKCV